MECKSLCSARPANLVGDFICTDLENMCLNLKQTVEDTTLDYNRTMKHSYDTKLSP